MNFRLNRAMVAAALFAAVMMLAAIMPTVEVKADELPTPVLSLSGDILRITNADNVPNNIWVQLFVDETAMSGLHQLQSFAGNGFNLGPYAAGWPNAVNITAHFVLWGGEETSPLSNIVTWVRTGTTPPGISNFNVTVSNSFAYEGERGDGRFPAGSAVTIRAGTRSGFFFAGWHSSVPMTFNQFSSTTSFTMPHTDVHLTAIWQPTSWHPDMGWNQDWWNQDWWHPDMGWHPDWWNQPGWSQDWWNQPGWHPDMGWHPDWWNQPGWQNQNWNWQWQSRNAGGVTFNFDAGNFPTTLALSQGSTVNLQLRVDRSRAHQNAQFMGQWLRNGTPHGASFQIGMDADGRAYADLRIGNLAPGSVGNYSLRVASVHNNRTTHVDISRVATVSISGQGPAITWPHMPELAELPAVQAMPTPRPNLLAPPVEATPPRRTAIAAAPDHNHTLVTNQIGPAGVVLQLGNAENVRLYGMTLDLLVDTNTTLFIVRDIVWTVLTPDFLEYLRERGGNFIGPNGGTFDIAILEAHGNEALVTAQIDISTMLNGSITRMTDFDIPFMVAVELRDFGIARANPQNIVIASSHGGHGAGHLNAETGLFSFGTTTTGSFTIDYVILW